MEVTVTIQAVNEFCQLFAELKKIIDKGEKGSPRHHDVVLRMRNVWERMDWKEQKKTLQWRSLLQEWGYYDSEIGKITTEGCEEESEVSGKFEHATFIVSEETGLPGFQYNEHSVQFKDLSPEDKARLADQMRRQWLLSDELMKIDPHTRDKILRDRWGSSSRQPKKWSILDSERDW